MKKRPVVAAWLLASVAVVIAVLAWLECLLVPFSDIGVYDVFPLFGIVAFSLMWSHYMVGAFRNYYGLGKGVFSRYFRLTSYAVLIALLLHPGLLIFQLQRDNAGLPLGYVAPSLRIYVILGMIAWVAFMLYELHRFFENRPWWRYVVMAGDVAMLFIVVHGYKLGCQIMPAWFMALWIFYGTTLIAAIIYGYYYRYKVLPK